MASEVPGTDVRVPQVVREVLAGALDAHLRPRGEEADPLVDAVVEVLMAHPVGDEGYGALASLFNDVAGRQAGTERR